jgi:hypothetical protein
LFSQEAFLRILGPVNPLKPSVSLLSPSVVGYCDDLIIDPTQSIGHGGRLWVSMKWLVLDLTRKKNATAITKFLNDKKMSSTSDLITIPNSMINSSNIFPIDTAEAKLIEFV